jgi:hypothetical protein
MARQPREEAGMVRQTREDGGEAKASSNWLVLKWQSIKWPPRKWLVATGAVVVLGVAAGVGFGWYWQTPKYKAISFAQAVQANDMATVRAVSTGSDAQYKTVEAMSLVFSAIRDYESAAVEKFGDAGKNKEMSLPDVVAEAKGSDVKTEGDTATLVNPKKPGDKHPMKLVKKDGKWYVDLSSMPVDGQTRVMSASAPRMKKALDETAAEVRAGKFKTAQEAQAALGARMQAAVRPG